MPILNVRGRPIQNENRELDGGVVAFFRGQNWFGPGMRDPTRGFPSAWIPPRATTMIDDRLMPIDANRCRSACLLETFFRRCDRRKPFFSTAAIC